MIDPTTAHSEVLLGDALVAGEDHHRIGGKASGLVHLIAARRTVPPFVVVPTDAFRAHLSRGGIPTALGEAMLMLSEIELDDADSGSVLARISATLCARVEATPIPGTFEAELLESLRHVGQGPYAVRSSMVGEDSASHSFAGQLDSELFQAAEDVLASVRRCWASTFGERALAYATRLKLPPTALRTAVVVQQMIDSEVSGVVFTANPVTGSREQCMVTATYGLGEGVVSGAVDADEYIWSAKSGEQNATIVCKNQQVVRSDSGSGTACKAVAEAIRERRALSQEQVAEVSRSALGIAESAKRPMDIEFCYAQGELYILQARPITSLPAPSEEGPLRFYDNSNIQESYNGVTTPLTFSFASRAYATVFRQFAQTLGASESSLADFEPAARTLIGLIRGRVFYNLGSWLQLLDLLPRGEQKKRDLELVMWHTTIEGGPSLKRSPLRRILRALELAKVGARLFKHFVRMESEIEAFIAHFHRVYDSIDRRALADASLAELFDIGQILKAQLLDRWETPNINDFRVLMTSGRLRRLLGKHYEEHAIDERLVDLLGGINGIESVEPTRLLIEIARDIRADPAAVASIYEQDPYAAMSQLQEHSPPIAARLAAYIERYGDRTVGELKLETVTFRDSPVFLVEILRNYLQLPDLDPKRLVSSERQRFEQARTDLARRVSPWRRAFLSWEVELARKAVKGREATRLRRTLAFGLARDIYRAAGERLTEAGVLDDAGDVLYLTVEEIDAFVEGRAVSVQLGPIASARKAEFARYAEISVPNRFRTKGSPYIGNELVEASPHGGEEQSSLDGQLTGLGCCAGVVQGEVRIILDPHSQQMDSGHILCTVRTDPGWAPLFPTISGLIVERGSALSHSAVVAREFGIPTVVGVPGVTTLLEDREIVRLDGAAGTIHRTNGRPNAALK